MSLVDAIQNYTSYTSDELTPKQIAEFRNVVKDRNLFGPGKIKIGTLEELSAPESRMFKSMQEGWRQVAIARDTSLKPDKENCNLSRTKKKNRRLGMKRSSKSFSGTPRVDQGPDAVGENPHSTMTGSKSSNQGTLLSNIKENGEIEVTDEDTDEDSDTGDNIRMAANKELPGESHSNEREAKSKSDQEENSSDTHVTPKNLTEESLKEKEAKAIRRDELAMRSFRNLETELMQKILLCIPDIARRNECLEILGVLKDKHLGEQDTSLWKLSGKHPHPIRKVDFEKRVGGEEEKTRPWMRSMADKNKFPKYLLRCWDEFSKCQIKDPTVGFLSYGSENLLNTHYSRKRGLAQHADFGNRFKTAFISTTSSSRDVEENLVPYRQRRQRVKKVKEYTRVSMINVHAILAKNKPVLRMVDELNHYEVRDGSGDIISGATFYKNEYIIPFSIAKDAIVNTWAWRDIETWMMEHKKQFSAWFTEVAMVAYEKHERSRRKRAARLREELEERKKKVEAKVIGQSDESAATIPNPATTDIGTIDQRAEDKISKEALPRSAKSAETSLE